MFARNHSPAAIDAPRIGRPNTEPTRLLLKQGLVTRLLATFAGLGLLAIPAAFFFTVLVPVVEYRQGGWTDFGAALASSATLYGGAAIGVVMAWHRNAEGRLDGSRMLRAGFWGAISAIGLVTGAYGLYGWLTGRFESAGALWALIPILGAVFSAMIAVGARLVWYGLLGSNTSRHQRAASASGSGSPQC